jgi:hypothetical protein
MLLFGRFRFLDPYRCAADNIAREGATYLTDFIEPMELDSIVFLPYHEGFEITQLYFNKKNI